MEPALSSVLLVFAHVVVMVAAGLAYLRHARIERPPIGVYNLRDILGMAVGVANIWAQSGIRVRDVALLAAGLAVYDLLATVVTPTMVEFFARVAALPLTPAVGWGSGAGTAGIGLGDLLLVLVWTLVAERTFGPRAGLVAATGCLLVVLAIDMAFWLDLVNRPVPAMVLLGPVIVGQFALLRRREGRTTEEYFAALAGETLPAPRAPRAPRSADLAVALRLVEPDGGGRARYLAVADGQVIASAATADEAVRAAGVAVETLGMRPDAVPTLVLSTAEAAGAFSASARRV